MVNSWNRQYQALVDRLIEYLWVEEERHWQELGEPEEHVFLILAELKEKRII